MEFNRVETEAQARELMKVMPDVVAIDTEYVRGDPRTTKLLSVIVADSERAWVISPSLLPMLSQTIRARKLVFLQDYNHCDTIILLKNGCDLRETNTHNLIDMAHLLDENAAHDLDSRVSATYGDQYKSVFWGKYDNFEDATVEDQLEYACKDAIYTYRLGHHDYITLKEVIGWGKKDILYEQHIRPLSKALLETELNGLCVNEDLIRDTKHSMGMRIAEFLPKLRSEFNDYCTVWEFQKWAEDISKLKSDAGRLRRRRPTFNFESDRQIAWLVYEALKLPVLNKTTKGNPSTDYETLEALAREYPGLQSLVEFKGVKSVYSTFVEGMLDRVRDGRIYPHFNVSGTSTGRISHSDPNMGNLPKEGVIRNFFIPSPGHCIIGADYAQLEVVVELNLTDDPGLKEIVLGGASKHDLFKADLDASGFSIPRSQVKNINFALQYGAGARKISKMVGCSQDEAERIIATFYTRFSGVKTLKDQTDRAVAENGYITNLAGRTRHFPKPRNDYELGRQQRQAYNFLIQGVAAEACNRAYYRYANWIKENGDGRGLFSVHDEIVCEVLQQDPQRPYWLMRQLEDTMEASTHDFGFTYPLKAVAYGPLDKWSKT